MCMQNACSPVAFHARYENRFPRDVIQLARVSESEFLAQIMHTSLQWQYYYSTDNPRCTKQSIICAY